MGHQVEDDVDTKRISDFFGEAAEIKLILPLPFPAVAHIAVEDRENQHSLPVIEDGADMHLVRAFPAKDGLQFRIGIVGIMSLVPKLDRGNLQAIHRYAKVIN